MTTAITQAVALRIPAGSGLVQKPLDFLAVQGEFLVLYWKVILQLERFQTQFFTQPGEFLTQLQKFLTLP